MKETSLTNSLTLASVISRLMADMQCVSGINKMVRQNCTSVQMRTQHPLKPL